MIASHCNLRSLVLIHNPSSQHQENAQSALAKSLGTTGAPHKRFEAPLVINSWFFKCVEARRIAAGYLFFSLTCSAGSGFRRNGRPSCLEQAPLYSTVHCAKLQGRRIGALPWTEHFSGSVFMKEKKEKALMESLRIAWKCVERTVVLPKRIGRIKRIRGATWHPALLSPGHKQNQRLSFRGPNCDTLST